MNLLPWLLTHSLGTTSQNDIVSAYRMVASGLLRSISSVSLPMALTPETYWTLPALNAGAPTMLM